MLSFIGIRENFNIRFEQPHYRSRFFWFILFYAYLYTLKLYGNAQFYHRCHLICYEPTDEFTCIFVDQISLGGHYFVFYFFDYFV